MSKLNKDVLFLIFEELKFDKKSLYSCLYVNRTWCETVVPILWRNPGQYLTTINSCTSVPILWKIPSQYLILFNVIFLHLSKESKDILKKQEINNLITEIYQRPLFNYINFWKYLDLFLIENIISSSKIEESKKFDIRDEILKLFFSSNVKFIHLSIPQDYDFQLHHIPGAERCFSELESLSFCCDFGNCQNILNGLARICKSIRKFRVDNVHFCTNNSGINKLIEVQKKLNNVSFIGPYKGSRAIINIIEDESIYKSLEESLIKHVDTIQYLRMDWIPITRILSYLVNLFRLEISTCLPYPTNWNELDYLKDLSLPNLKILITRQVPIKITANLIEITKGQLTEISVLYNDADSKNLFKAICQNYFDIMFNWDKLLLILAKSSPTSLFTFEFHSGRINLEDIILFFDNWTNRNPMLLEIDSDNYCNEFGDKKQLEDLIEKYKDSKSELKNERENLIIERKIFIPPQTS
ncbi:6885_t:CDS:2 [Rhizophagus irregularis]|nr:6885_t:CDS:2 [Rhizophagus irregularis]